MLTYGTAGYYGRCCCRCCFRCYFRCRSWRLALNPPKSDGVEAGWGVGWPTGVGAKWAKRLVPGGTAEKRLGPGGEEATVVPFARTPCASPLFDEPKMGCLELVIPPNSPVPAVAAAGVGLKLNMGRGDGIWGGSGVTAAEDGVGSPSGVGDLEGVAAPVPISPCLHLYQTYSMLT